MFETSLTVDTIARYQQAGVWGRTILWDYVADTARAAPERLAVWDMRGSLSYGQLVANADRVALGLLELGVRTGDVVSVQLPNRIEFAVLLLALERIGAVMNPITTSLRGHEIREILELAQSRVLVVP